MPASASRRGLAQCPTSSFGPRSNPTACPSRMCRLGVASSSRRMSTAYSCLSVCARSAHTAGPCARDRAYDHLLARGKTEIVSSVWDTSKATPRRSMKRWSRST